MSSAVITQDDIPQVTIKTNMFQGSFSTKDATIDTVTKRLKDPTQRVSCFTTSTPDCMLMGLKINTVKFAKKGKLGESLYTWNDGELMDVHWSITEQCGSIQLSCLTVPYNMKVSIFFFGSGKVKICGALIDPYTAAVKKSGFQIEEVIDKYSLLNDAVQTYMNELKSLTCVVLGATPDVVSFEPGIMNGQFELGMHISNLNDLCMFATRNMKDTFAFVRGQEPEINGRKFSVQLFISEKLHMSFDHLGKVQIFCAKSFSDMTDCWKAFIDLITRAMDKEIIQLSDLPEKKSHKSGFKIKKRKRENQFAHFLYDSD